MRLAAGPLVTTILRKGMHAFAVGGFKPPDKPPGPLGSLGSWKSQVIRPLASLRDRNTCDNEGQLGDEHKAISVWLSQ